MFCGLACDLSWMMFHVHLKRMCILLLFSLVFAILITVYFDVVHFGLILLGAFCAFWTWMYVSFRRLGNFSAIISSNNSSSTFSLLLLGPHTMQMLVPLMLSQRSLKLSSFLFIIFSFFCSASVISTTLSSSSLIHSSVSFNVLLISSSVYF